jgi:uroporphyrinogen-III decarboxylase
LTNRERLQNTLSFKHVDRLPKIEWASWWDLTLNRWKTEGLPSDVNYGMSIFNYFNLDNHMQFWLAAMNENCPQPAGNGLGIIENESDYNKIYKFLYPSDRIKNLLGLINSVKQGYDKGDIPVWLTLEGFFWYPRQLFGIENHLYAFYDYPELYHRICSDLADFHIMCIEQFCEIMVPEFITFAEDMSYNHGPMLSKETFDEFIMPYYKKVIPHLKQRGIKVIIDSDGDITKMVPWFMEAGIDGVLPLERQAGVDINYLRDKFPDFLFIGGYDKLVMKNGENAMRKEFERILPAMKKGGYIPSVDHQTPPEVSMDNYRIYEKLLNEYCIKAVQ